MSDVTHSGYVMYPRSLLNRIWIWSSFKLFRVSISQLSCIYFATNHGISPKPSNTHSAKLNSSTFLCLFNYLTYISLAETSFYIIKIPHHVNVIKREHFSHYWLFVRGIYLSPGGLPSQRPVRPSFDVLFDLSLNKPLSKQPKRRWFETSPSFLWRQCNYSDTILPCLQPWMPAINYVNTNMICSLVLGLW